MVSSRVLLGWQLQMENDAKVVLDDYYHPGNPKLFRNEAQAVAYARVLDGAWLAVPVYVTAQGGV